VPTPIADNHMIITTFVNNKPIFLDATAKYLTYGLPSPFIQGKEALISKANNAFEIVKVPEVSAEKNKTEITSLLTIDTKNLLLEGEHTFELHGYEKLHFLHKLDKKEENNLSFLYYNLKFGTKKTAFNDVKYDHLNIEKPYLKINFKTNTKGYLRKIDNEIYIKPNLDFNLKKELIRKESLKYDKKIEFKFKKVFKTSLSIPKGYFIEKLPKNVIVNDDLFSLEILYSFSEDKTKVNINKILQVKTLLIKPSHTQHWNRFIKTLNKSNKQNLILKRQ
jgi:hypothetical protein